MKKSIAQGLREQSISYLFVAPDVILFVVFIVGPHIASFYWSFTEFNGIQSAKWVGLANYRNIFFHDPRFWKAIRNTIFYTVGVIPPGIALSLLLAIAVDQKIRQI